ncbi:tetratricopeptide repeat protein 8 [Dermatophagoides pteronyssinus]|uniref:tetratricopeptide repeat protein 8 n=1 Tax=Dermatophagoides pteronyssinus TaxID=6956 RepID=UPI003F680985
MDPLCYAMSLYRRRYYDRCMEICNEQIEQNPKNQLFWCLKLRCLTEQTYVDDLEADEDGIAETLMDETRIAETARPGTSLRTATPTSLARQSTSQAIRPVTQSGRPLSGMIRPGTNSIGPNQSLESALSAPRTGYSARPMTTASGRHARLGTASMIALQESGGEFLNVERLNIDKYSKMAPMARALFEYIFHNQCNFRIALQLALKTNVEMAKMNWWWKAQIGKCYYKLALLRDSEEYFRDALQHYEVAVDVYIWLGKVYIRMDQPLKALDLYRQGLEKHPNETLLLRYAARIHESMNEMDESIGLYRSILNYNAIDIEAIASIAMNEFYSDQPEIALRYYRRLLQMGIFKSEIYNNIALCCFYSQQYDMVVTCFERALMFAETDEMIADIWYNIGHVALGSGDRQLALYCFRLASSSNNDHAEAYNNLGVLEITKGIGTSGGHNYQQPNTTITTTTANVQQAKSYFQSSANVGSYLYEPHYNLALLAENSGHFDLSYEYVQKSLNLYPDHYASKELKNRVWKLYEAV